jgi:hypothetical protein
MPPVAAAIAAIASSFAAAATAATITSIIVKTAITIGLTLLARALTPKPKIRETGIQTSATTSGGVDPQRFILGTYATAGHIVAPPYSHTGASGNTTPNGLLNYIIELSNISGVTLSRVIVDDDYSQIDTSPGVAGEYGAPLLGQRRGGVDYGWIKFYNGTQTAADAMLVAKYASHPERPWTADAVGRGSAYAILTFLYNRKVYNNLPAVRFEVNGISLYDPRLDSSVGGSGTQRFATPSTWAFSANPIVMIYNIMRGLSIGNGNTYGGGVEASSLPLDNWMAAMNACDVFIGARRSFTAGFEVDVTTEPAQLIEELLKTCLGQISEYGGVFRVRVGAPSTAVYFLNDDDIVISDAQDLDPFPGLEQTYNAIAGTYPEPQSMWQGRQAEPIYNATWEAEDGDRRLPVELNFPACSNNSQVAQLMNAYINDQRRFRVHRLVLPPDAAILEPLDTIAWTSVRNGYSAKLFEIVELTDRVDTLCQEVMIRERDPSDYSWTSANDLPLPANSTGVVTPAAQPIDAWLVEAFTIRDGLGLARRPAIRLAWNPLAATDSDLIRYEIRLATGAVVTSGTAATAPGFVIVSDGLVPATAYQARGQYIVDRPTEFSAYLDVTTPAVFVSDDDFEGGVKNLFRDAGLSAPEIVSSLPTSGNFQGRLVFLTSDNKLYRFTGAAFTAAVPTGDLSGQIIGDQITANTITGGLIAGAGIITQTAQIDDAVIARAKIQELAVDTLRIADNAVIIPVGAFSSTPTYGIGIGAEITVFNVTITLDFPARIAVTYMHATVYGFGNKATNSYMDFNGSRVITVPAGGALVPSVSMAYIAPTELPAGAHTVQIVWEGQDSQVYITSKSLVVQGIKK